MALFSRFARLTLMPVLALLLFLTASCSKKKEARPTPTLGKITGTAAPAAALASVTATDANGASTTVTPNSSSGDFSIANLSAGT